MAQRSSNGSSAVSWTALVLGAGGLILAVFALADDGTGLAQDTQERVDRAITSLNLEIARNRAAVALSELEERREAGEDVDVQAELQRIRNELEIAFIEAEAQTSAEWRDLSQSFAEIMRDADARGEAVLEGLETLIANIRESETRF